MHPLQTSPPLYKHTPLFTNTPPSLQTHPPHYKHIMLTLVFLIGGRTRAPPYTCSKHRPTSVSSRPLSTHTDHTANHIPSWYWWVAGPGLACARAASSGNLLSRQDHVPHKDQTVNHIPSWYWWVAGPGIACARAASSGKLVLSWPLSTQTILRTTCALDSDEWQGQALPVHVQQAQESFCPVKTAFPTQTTLQTTYPHNTHEWQGQALPVHAQEA
jgi:hypothetical protein